MPFHLYLVRTVNGEPKVIRWHDQPDGDRPKAKELIDFYESAPHPEATLTIYDRCWSWADIRDIWIEEA